MTSCAIPLYGSIADHLHFFRVVEDGDSLFMQNDATLNMQRDVTQKATFDFC
jgi:hypothetical protein